MGNPGGHRQVIDFMPPRDEVADIVRIVEGVSGSVRMHGELALRFDYGHIMPWVRRDKHGLHAIAGPDAAYFVTNAPLHGENMHSVSDFTVQAGERVPFVLTWAPSHVPRPHTVDAEGAGHNHGLLARLGVPVHRARASTRMPWSVRW